jgi:hypothetical protein
MAHIVIAWILQLDVPKTTRDSYISYTFHFLPLPPSRPEIDPSPLHSPESITCRITIFIRRWWIAGCHVGGFIDVLRTCLLIGVSSGAPKINVSGFMGVLRTLLLIGVSDGARRSRVVGVHHAQNRISVEPVAWPGGVSASLVSVFKSKSKSRHVRGHGLHGRAKSKARHIRGHCLHSGVFC